MSIQTHPPQSIIKNIGNPLNDYLENMYGANPPTSGRNSGKMVLTLKGWMALRDGGGGL